MCSVLHSPLARFILLFGALYAAFGVHSPFFPSFLSARGLKPEAVGVFLAAGTGIRLVAAPLAGLLADRLGKSRGVLALSLSGASFAALAYLPVQGFWPLLLVTLIAAVALAPLAPMADALALRAGQGHHGTKHRTFEYGQVRGAGSAAFVMGSLVAGLAIGKTGLTAILFLQAGLFAVAALFCLRVPQTRWAPPESEVHTSWYSSKGTGAVWRLLAIPLYRRIVLVAALVFGSHAMHDAFAVVRWVRAGISPELISLLWSESVAAEVVLFLVIGPRLLGWLGPAKAAALCAIAGFVRWVLMAQTVWIPALMLAQPLHGFTFALLHLACMRLLSEVVPASLTATGLTLYGTLGSGVASVVLTLGSGLLYGRLGPGGFWVMAILCAIAIPLALMLKPPRTVQR